MSSPLNPLPPGDVGPPSELPSGLVSGQATAAPLAKSSENPPWTFWDLVLLVVLFFVLINVAVVVAMVVVGTTHLFGYDIRQLFHDPRAFDNFQTDPRVMVPVLCIGYLVLLAMMAMVIRIRQNVPRGFFESIGWRWPRGAWPGFVIAGAALQIVGQFVSQWLPVPRSVPFDKLLQTPTYAYVMSAFGILIAPVVEELFFRGFLYPVLARSLGEAAGVIITSLAFTLMHGSQYGFSWALLLIIFIVGFTLTLVRARTRSVAASVLLHMSYNATLFAMFFIGTGGFKHLERS